MNVFKSNNICHINMANSNKTIQQEIQQVWGKYIAYHIYNVVDLDYETQYENIAETLGKIDYVIL